MALTLRTQLPVEEAARRVTDAIVNGSFSAELVAQSDSRGPDGAQCVTLLFDKYFLRAGNHCALCCGMRVWPQVEVSAAMCTAPYFSASLAALPEKCPVTA